MGLASDQCLDLSRIALRQDHDPQWFHIPWWHRAKLGSVVEQVTRPLAAHRHALCQASRQIGFTASRIEWSSRHLLLNISLQFDLAGLTLPRWGRVVVYGVISCKRNQERRARQSPPTGRPTDDWMSM